MFHLVDTFFFFFPTNHQSHINFFITSANFYFCTRLFDTLIFRCFVSIASIKKTFDSLLHNTGWLSGKQTMSFNGHEAAFDKAAELEKKAMAKAEEHRIKSREAACEAERIKERVEMKKQEQEAIRQEEEKNKAWRLLYPRH